MKDFTTTVIVKAVVIILKIQMTKKTKKIMSNTAEISKFIEKLYTFKKYYEKTKCDLNASLSFQ